MKKKVIVGLSGGVDSSVAAYLLIQQGYEVEGLFMRNWDSSANNDILGNQEIDNDVCPQEQDYLDALEVANKLGIKLHRIDFVQEYWEYVFEYFIKEYKKGRTPNPDILCNKYIKFDKFLNHAINELKADYIAMGHYAGVRFNEKTKQYEMIRAVDTNKDQTYFLCQLTQNQLSKTLFPLQSLEKPEIRKIAAEQGLITADKKDSTGICFIGEREFTKFLQNYISNQPGDIVDIKTNEVLGKHIGAMYYTIGQRKGLNLGGMKEPYYVAAKDIDKKIIYVCPASDESYLLSNNAIVTEINWSLDLKQYIDNVEEFECTAKFRYRQPDVKVRLNKIKDNEYKVSYDAIVKAVTPGQEAVFYLNDICLGGGIIDIVE
ncbi:tRNA(5-methylaminomethyl-2-thiouridylate)-methyltransferase [Mesoplasma florum L1]|uniref:tRNA-specific 2-thiouridylase MnmA n=1 Tax=Mesoplasma florum (strain ATCC 33453 / NBRC 100688 / NCTC 11704 / L1) TaxID=265311 RepID=MNMA_MESFL|nr:tRNA 2-thiouridine(34) synthase MnmA [Mesoplasma florum]Q6F152.1 RecName: Full=tRNA-specific 2-thiouridylase MnmA [Mesoplasma florum L1]AAT75771.1 tRNA(5-methylaminomethyl-2-thiouridylate)-methyltransferase [Mesoplasma florum L1]ATI73372.1 tRNA 2-thiouridine(34) synthase MnmA [Mesoplasma florum]AVN61772.1 tRNA 2-thiouridine(34) synthase MnmA [Mesoplasma florum]